MMKYKLTSLLFFVPFMITSGLDRFQQAGWRPVWGALEIALALAISVGAAREIRDGRRRRRAAGESRQDQ
ncbi:hypothetical protein ACFVAM_24025 [Streptomyces californicus]|uniref:hypothetical protein n=1 Tax=Streptomyces TaxID=1883 RepID=UPI000BF10B87|nr:MULTISPECIES: hypothetical protein [Streptomyces]MCF3169391.1 hypothetical protein [Streptomyces violaceoruber]MDW4899684.1 hypothetical protein [Streptomyces californicus]QLG34720.1 hypothetical protein HXS80_26020 [Streptomyces sp. CB04723]